MKKKFSFEISKEHVISLTKQQQKAVRGGLDTDACAETLNDRCEDQEPQTIDGCEDPPSTLFVGCDTYGCPPDTAMLSTCTSPPNTHFGCNTSENNCWITKSCPNTAADCETVFGCP